MVDSKTELGVKILRVGLICMIIGLFLPVANDGIAQINGNTRSEARWGVGLISDSDDASSAIIFLQIAIVLNFISLLIPYILVNFSYGKFSYIPTFLSGLLSMYACLDVFLFIRDNEKIYGTSISIDYGLVLPLFGSLLTITAGAMMLFLDSENQNINNEKQKIKEQKISNRSKTFTKIIERSDRLEIRQLSDLLNLKEKDLLLWLYDLPKEFGFRIDQNMVIFDRLSIDTHIDELLHSFDKMEETHSGKI